jgi:competence protein ComFC
VGGRLISWQRAGAWLGAAGDALASIAFPAECRLCERLLTWAKRIPICAECLGSFATLPPQICRICGQPAGPFPVATRETSASAGEEPGAVCRSCELRTYAFDRARSYALYEAGLVRAIVLLKFEAIHPLGEWFAERLVEVLRREEGLGADIVVPVPLHRQRERERGYNQANLIARPLARKLKLPYQPVLLVRKKPRPDKHILTVRERWESVRGAFATRKGAQVDNQRVLLVDDVMTTGATLDACAKVLRGAGARSVIGLTVARAARHPVTLGASDREDE